MPKIILCLFLCFVIVSCGEENEDRSDAENIVDEIDCSIESQGTNQPFISITNRRASKKNIKLARENIYRVRGKHITLLPPVNWRMDPYSDRSWRYALHTLAMLLPLLRDYEENNSLTSLTIAAEISLDWIENNQAHDELISEFAWYDMAVGIRVTYLSYIAAELDRIKHLGAQKRKQIRCSVVEHSEWLYDDANYKFKHNHGLFEDAGLFIAAKNYTSHPRAAAWLEKSEYRFVTTVNDTVDQESGIHLEHSPAYHLGMTKTIEWMWGRWGLGRGQLDQLVDKMNSVSSWFVMPDNRLPQFGDTNLSGVPTRVGLAAADSTGFRMFKDAGVSIYRDENSYLGFISWHHSSAHKHSDELSFVWAEKGKRIIIDSGRYGYYYQEDGRVFAESSPAHNTVIFGSPFRWRESKPYGSGMLDSRSKAGWYAMLATNRALKTDELEHKRVLLYRPAEVLIIADFTQGVSCEAATGFLHFAPEFQVDRKTDRSVALSSNEDELSVELVTDWDSIYDRRGEKDPVQGFTFPSNRKWVPNHVIELHSIKTCNAPLLTFLTVDQAITIENIKKKTSTVSFDTDNQNIRIGVENNRLKLDVQAR